MSCLKYLPQLLVSLVTLDLVTAREAALGVNSIVNKAEIPNRPKTNYFVELVAQGIFVDKTLLIDAIIENSERVSVITCPRKWGKTTNLDMLRTFLQIPVHANGTKILPLSDAPSYQLFEQRKYLTEDFRIELERPLLISSDKYKTLRERYLGQYPVIRLSFAGVSSTSVKKYTTVLGRVVAKAFEEHKYLLKAYDLRAQNEDDKNREPYEKGVFVSFLKNRADTEEDLLNSVIFLSQELYYHFRKDVFILIDDYDLYLDFNLEPTTENVIQFFYKKTFKDNQFLRKAILTGFMPKEVKYDDTVHYDFLDNPYFYPFYGYTFNELNLMYYVYQMLPDEQKHVQFWYGGYETPENVQERLFNPWSVIEYMNVRETDPYWVNETSRDIHLHRIFEIPEFQYVFSHLITGQCYDVGGLHVRFHLSFLATKLDLNTAFAYMLTAGYLTPVKALRLEGFSKRISLLKIPNYEIASHLQTISATKLGKLYNRSNYECLKNTSAMLSGFLMSNELTSPELENHFKSMGMFTKEDLFHSIVMSIIAAPYFEFINWPMEDFPQNETNIISIRSDILLSCHKRGLIINIQQGNDTESAIDLYTRQNLVVFEKYEKFHFWRDIKLVDCKITPNKTIEISSVVHLVKVQNEPNKESD